MTPGRRAIGAAAILAAAVLGVPSRLAVQDLDGRRVWRRVACGPVGRRDPVGSRPSRGRAPA